MAPKERRQRRPFAPLPTRSQADWALFPFAAARVTATIPKVDSDYLSRRVKRHLIDLERTNYIEATAGPSTYGEGHEREDQEAPSNLLDDDSTSGQAPLPIPLCRIMNAVYADAPLHASFSAEEEEVDSSCSSIAHVSQNPCNPDRAVRTSVFPSPTPSLDL